MRLDYVHDIQKSFRKVLDSMSRPGLINNISKESEKVDLEINFFNSTLVLMFMLLDSDISFKIISEKEEDITSFINKLTYAKSKNTEKADFIFVLRDAKPIDLVNGIKNAKSGDLINPHKAATIIVEVEEISNNKTLSLTGPGIERVNYAHIEAENSWILARSEKNEEYPLGIDMIFIDKESNILCLPRTTALSTKVVK